MNYKISKKLFEVVMGFKIVMPPIIEVDNTVIGYLIYGRQDTPTQVHQNHRRIPINDFFFKCKEWALFSRDIEIRSFKTKNIVDGVYCLATSSKMQRTFKSSSEQQSVFDACQWILDNKDKQ